MRLSASVAALTVNPEEVIVLGGLMAEHDTYDVRRNIEVRGQRCTGPSQVVARPTARSRSREDRFRPTIPVVQFGLSRTRKYKGTPVRPISHRFQHRSCLSRQRDDMRQRRHLFFSRATSCILSSPGGDRPDTRVKIELVPRRRTDFI